MVSLSLLSLETGARRKATGILHSGGGAGFGVAAYLCFSWVGHVELSVALQNTLFLREKEVLWDSIHSAGAPAGSRHCAGCWRWSGVSGVGDSWQS